MQGIWVHLQLTLQSQSDVESWQHPTCLALLWYGPSLGNCDIPKHYWRPGIKMRIQEYLLYTDHWFNVISTTNSPESLSAIYFPQKLIHIFSLYSLWFLALWQSCHPSIHVWSDQLSKPWPNYQTLSLHESVKKDFMTVNTIKRLHHVTLMTA